MRKKPFTNIPGNLTDQMSSELCKGLLFFKKLLLFFSTACQSEQLRGEIRGSGCSHGISGLFQASAESRM
jgi:hypothetical protein